jgi:tRNA threonylcarbamoyladenosine biosynthesis protein TsaE
MDENVCILVGDLGAGKTTFVQAIVSIISPGEKVTSPTFSLINEYETKNGDIYHMDLYRLNSLEEALDIGIEEYFYKGNCFVEWPQIIEDILPDTYYIIEIENLGNFVRLLKLRRVSN